MNRAGITGESRLRVGCLRVNLFRFLEGVVAAVAVAVAAVVAWVLPRLFLLDSPENKQSVSTWS
ncbi:MAG: hypothetical protein WB614_07010 [Pseudolabrys sp.]|jgi:hypothetical protein